MTLQLKLDYRQVIQLAQQLTATEQDELVSSLLVERATQRPLTAEERLAVFNAMTVDLGEMLPAYSDQRSTWYDDDAS